MNLSPTDRDKLQAYLDALEAVPIPRITTSLLQVIAASVANDVADYADSMLAERKKRGIA